MIFDKSTVGKKIRNKKTGEITRVEYYAASPSVGLANGIGFCTSSGLSDDWELYNEKEN